MFLYISDAFEILTGRRLDFINLVTYGITGKTNDHIVFKVMTCQDARIALVPTPDFSSLMYDVALAGWNNQRTVIRTKLEDNEKIVARKNERNIVNCYEFRDFWVSWTDNHIKSGKGRKIGQDILVDYDDSVSKAYEVNFVGISTGFGASGKWIFENGN